LKGYDGANPIEALRSFLGIPLGSPDGVFGRFLKIPGAIYRGEGLNRFLYVRGSRSNRVLLVAHADTFWDREYGYDPGPTHKIRIEDGNIRAVDEEFGLGADDRAGCAMLWLLKDLGHSLLVTNGEEHGQTGSSWLMDDNEDIADEINRDHQFMIQLDRCGGTDFKCYKVGTPKFKAYIKAVTKYSDAGAKRSTDISELCRDITGVNLSIGYQNEHNKNEFLNIAEWEHTFGVVQKWPSERKLPKFTLRFREDRI
jgi:hypothetical protein